MNMGVPQSGFDVAARQLARYWTAAIWADDAPPAAVDTLVSTHDANGEPRLGWLSRGFQALARGRTVASTPEQAQQLRGEIDALRAHGCERATRLAEVALATLLGRMSGREGEAIEILLRHGSVDDDPRPPAERVWTDACLSLQYAKKRQFEAALRSGLAAEQLANRAELPILRALAARSLSFTFLSLGDVDGALDELQREVSICRSHGVRKMGTFANLMLALILSGRSAEVLTLSESEPWLTSEALLQGRPTLGALLLCAMTEQGQLERARELLRKLKPSPDTGESQLVANRLWLSARTLMAIGEPATAHRELTQALADYKTKGPELSPMNGTQLYEVYSSACEALGDTRGAMAALRESQAYWANWLGQRTYSQLQMLRLQSGSADSAETLLRRRTRAIDSLVARIVDESRHDRTETGNTEAAAAPVVAPAPAPVPTPTDARAAVATTAAAPLLEPRRDARIVGFLTRELHEPHPARGTLRPMLMPSAGGDGRRDWTQLTESSAQLLMQLCHDLLDLARIEANRFELRPEPTDVAALLHEAMAMLTPNAELKGLHVDADIAPGLPRLLVDGHRFMQVVLNLLSNAVKFTTTGHVVLSANWQDQSPQHGQLHVAVIDTGPGLSPPQLALLFEEFARLPARPADAAAATEEAAESAGSAAGGLGVGLSLCRSLVRRMDGELSVSSMPGVGSTFSFVLPLTIAGPTSGPGTQPSCGPTASNDPTQ